MKLHCQTSRAQCDSVKHRSSAMQVAVLGASAVELARAVDGVQRVINEMSIKK